MSTEPPHSNSNERLWGLRPVRWGLRMFGDRGGSIADHLAQDFASRERREVTDFLGLQVPTGDKPNLASRLVEAWQARRQYVDHAPDIECVLNRNLLLLRDAFDLSEAELDILSLGTVVRLHPGLETLVDTFIKSCVDFDFYRKLVWVLDVPDKTVRSALAQTGPLVTKGLISVTRGDKRTLPERIHVSTAMVETLIEPADSINALFEKIFPPQREATLPLEAYPHLAREIALIRDRLGVAIEMHAKGVNVLLHGPPGTGKTELAASLAQSLDRPLYAVETASLYLGSCTPRDRMRSVTRLQRLVDATAHSLVLVDEAEDLFPTAWSDSQKTPTKASVNECLETNPIPTIWICNRTEHLDEAFLRRFDLIVHVPPIPASARGRLLQDSLPDGVLKGQELRSYAEKRELSAAVITRMAEVATSGSSCDPQAVRDNLRLVANHYLRTLGASPLPDSAVPLFLEHDLGMLNTTPPMDTVFGTMAGAQFGVRMLLHGVPGSGKTAFARELSERLGKPLLQRQASTLLSMWLGGTEKNIRDMFEEARLEGGVLLLDEADSFLRDRDRARASWEATQTNELLTQMEAFDGILVCTTNRLDDLDTAALRRFDLKVEFKPLRLDQRQRLIGECCEALGIDSESQDAWTARASLLEGLTPGDATAALRRLRLAAGHIDVTALLDALSDECRYKPKAHAPIGFMH